MKTKILSAILISTFIFNTAFALTQDDIDMLYELGFISENKMVDAKKALNSSQNNSTPLKTETKFVYGNKTSNTAVAPGGCLRLTYDLVNGASGVVVTSLQNFLKNNGYFSEESTGYFGNLTQQAVEKFQKAEGIVLSGTPETTGLGKVGPATRATIQKLTCATADATKEEMDKFFGFDLDELFDNPPEMNYQVYDFNKYNVNLDYDVNLDYEVDLDYDIDLDYDFEFDEIDLGFGAGDEKAMGVLLFAKAVNGQHMRGGNQLPVAVSGRDVELVWDSKNAGDCNLSGDFKEKSLPVPTNGSANLTLQTASGGKAANGDPMYRFKITCYATSTQAVTIPASDTLLLWIYRATTTTP